VVAVNDDIIVAANDTIDNIFVSTLEPLKLKQKMSPLMD